MYEINKEVDQELHRGLLLIFLIKSSRNQSGLEYVAHTFEHIAHTLEQVARILEHIPYTLEHAAHTFEHLAHTL